MAKKFKNLSLFSTNLRRKLMVGFSLMAVIPLLILAYLTTSYIFPREEHILNISIIVVIGVVIAILGFYLTKPIFHSVIEVSGEAKRIAEGDIERTIKVKNEGEVGDLEKSLNIITEKLRENMAEIQQYGNRVRNVNIEIGKKMMALSSLLQIGNLMVSSPELEKVMPLILDKISRIAFSETIFLMVSEQETKELVMMFTHNIKSERLKNERVKFNEGFLGKIAARGERVLIDGSVKLTKQMKEFTDDYGMRNACFLPISLKEQLAGLLVMGNNLTDLVYQKDDLELINIFARQIAIAIENDWLAKEAENLAVRDKLTGLYNEKYIKNHLKEEIKRAIMYQRPCSVVMLNIDDFEIYKKNNGELAAESILKKIAKIISDNITDIDRLARSDEDIFTLVLPEKNKGEAVKAAEKIRKQIAEFSFPGEKAQPAGKLTVSAGVSANPIDGLTAIDLLDVASASAGKAKKEGKNRIVG